MQKVSSAWWPPPFGSLDALTREILQDELLRIYQLMPRTMVFITHSIEEAIAMGDRILVLSARPARVRELLAGDALAIDLRPIVDYLAGHIHGISDADFQKLAEEAKEGCPVSKAFKGNVDLKLKASLDQTH